MKLKLLKRIFSYLVPQAHLAAIGVGLIFLLTFSGAVSIIMLKPIFDGILVKSKAELIESEKKTGAKETLRFAKDFSHYSYIIIKDAVKRKVTLKQAKNSISSYFNNYLKTGPASGVLILVAIFISIGIGIKTMSEYARRMIFLVLNLRIMTRVRMDMYKKVMTFSMPFFNEYKSGYLLNRIIGEVNVIQDLIVSTASGILTNIVMAAFYFFMILYIDWKLTLALIVCFIPLIFLLDRLAVFLKKFQHKIQEVLGAIYAVAQETLCSMRLVVASNTQNYETKRYEKAVFDYQRLTLKLSKYDLLAAPISELVTTAIGLGIVVYALKTRVINPNSTMTAGDFVVYITFMFAMMKPIKDLNSFFVSLQRSLVVAGRVFDIMDRHTTIIDAPDALHLPEFKESIEFRNITFAYRKDTPVLKNICFRINKGDVVALVGPSGGGKSTLVDLLPRLYDPDNGDIFVDNKNIKGYTLSSLRGKMGIVTQETILFHDTVRNNIAYGLEGISDEKIRKAAEIANASEFIEELPEKYNTIIGDRGTRLSGGQRQRLSIARAILRNPAILIFDEATSALDNESEAKVQNAIDHLIENRTAVVVAHRLSTIKRANKIIVIDEGIIKEHGTHEELIQHGGVYKRLYDLQFRENK